MDIVSALALLLALTLATACTVDSTPTPAPLPTPTTVPTPQPTLTTTESQLVDRARNAFRNATPQPNTTTTESQQASLQRFAQSFWEGPEYICFIRDEQGACVTYDHKWTVYWFFAINFSNGTMVSLQLNHVVSDNFGLSATYEYAYVETCFHQDYRKWHLSELSSCEDDTFDLAIAITALRQSIANDWPELLQAFD